MTDQDRNEEWESAIPELPASIREVLQFAEATEPDPAKTISVDLSLLREPDEVQSDELIQMAIDHAEDGIVIVVPSDGRTRPTVRYVNHAFTRITGRDSQSVTGCELALFGVADADDALLDAMEHPLCQRKAFEGESVAKRANGSEFTMRLLLVPIHGEIDQVRLWVAYLRDVTEEKAQMQSLEHQALHDVLTGLPNRALFVERLEAAVHHARSAGESVGLLMVDLDRFKEVNDTFGHHYGDMLLVEVGERLADELENGQTLARMGGDEFALVIPSVGDPGGTIRLARKIINALLYPFEIEKYRLEVGVSVGIAVFPDHGDDATSLLRRADAAMYKAKREGIGFSMFTDELEEEDPATLSLAVELREAIENGWLQMFYQPKIHLKTGVVVGVEALARWKRREGYILPERFIGIAEKTGQIGALTEWAIDTVLLQAARWKKAGRPLSVAVNVSGRSFHEHILPQQIFQKLQFHGLDPHQFKLEITESNILADPPQALAILSLLKSLGLKISLDDFGTGYSSLTHLRQLPVDEIKIDKSFVMGMISSDADTAIVRAMVDLAHSLGRQVVAEGVADEEICRKVASLGVDVAQGYCFMRPSPPERLEEWLAETNWGKDAWSRIMENHADDVFDV